LFLEARRGSRWRLRDWRLRTKLTAVLLVPLVLAGVLGVLRVNNLVRTAHDLAALSRQVEFAQRLGSVVYNLQTERYRVVTMLAHGRPANSAAFQAQAQRVDSAVAALRAVDSGTAAFPAAAADQWVPTHRAALSRLSELSALRLATVSSNATASPNATVSPNATASPKVTPAPNAAPGMVAARNAITAYSGLIAALLDLDRRAMYGVPGFLDPQADGVKELAVAEEQASCQQVVLLTGILSGGLSAEQVTILRDSEVRFDAAADEFSQALSPGQQQNYFTAKSVVDRQRLLDAAVDRAVRAAPLETVPADWESAAEGAIETIHQGQITLLGKLHGETTLRSDRAWRDAVRDGLVVVALLLLAVGLLVVVVRSLLQPLRALRTAAFEVADRRLPEAAEQLRATDGAPGQPTVAPVPVHSREEVGQVARAVDEVHSQAVRLASEQAQLRCSLNDVFLTLSRRSQCLVKRQLQLVEDIRGIVPPDSALVDSVVDLDRVAAQMRRHSENLLVLAGGRVQPAAEPVEMCDVLERAVSEIADYQWVTVGSSPVAVVAGAVVNDLVHLIAELLDNATSVTSQGTMVTLSVELTENHGLQVDITDSGPGLSPDELQEINGRLASVPTVDATVRGQVGMFVVRELAAHHGITVRLRPRLGDRGVIATALLPPSLVTIDFRALAKVTPPLQVSVIDEATPEDLFSPTSITPTSRGVVTSMRKPSRTAQDEWRELFGHHEPGPAERAAGSDQLDGGQPPTSAAVEGVAAAEQPPQVCEEIYEMVSAWFREQQSAPPSTSTPEWRSPFDAGWQAAQALRALVDHEFTRAGLPKRQPRAHLVSEVDGRILSTPVPAGSTRTPDAVRGRLSRYQRGLQVGRHARIVADEQPTLTDIARLPGERRLFEENQQ
ncbi:MAG: sensor histidine kinase, partial [Pseudonocardiaceae bacterium]